VKGKDMKFMRQSQTIKVINVDNKVQTAKEVRKHGNMLPISIRGVICGPSNYGKTNVLISLLENSLAYASRMCICTRSQQQPKYRYLKNLLTSIEEIGYFTFSNNGDVVPSNEALSNSIFVFDDVVCDKQDAIREYFMMGRHADVASICVKHMQRY